MADQPGLKGHRHHWYPGGSNANGVKLWSCAGCDAVDAGQRCHPPEYHATPHRGCFLR